MKPIDIVLTCWKREQFTKLTIDTLAKNTKYPYRLIVVDNGSYIRSYLSDAADIYVKLDRNRGLEYAKWVGFQFVESDYFISTDNDILVPRREGENACWLTALLNLAEQRKEYKAISLRPQILVGTGNIFAGVDDDVLEFTHVPGYMRIMDTAAVRDIGAWTDKRPLRGHEEYWMSERMRQKGFKVGWATKIHCWHLFGEGNWGYGDIDPKDHGHTPTNLPKDDWAIIQRDYVG